MRLHVGGLVPEVRDDEVVARFAPFGVVRRVDVVRDDSAACRGFACVDLEATEAQLEQCVKVYSKSKWRGRKLTVGPAKPHYIDRLKVCELYRHRVR